MLMRTDPFRDLDRFTQQVLGTAARPAVILAVDTPSGLPSDGQDYGGPVICAEATVTLTAPKVRPWKLPRKAIKPGRRV